MMKRNQFESKFPCGRYQPTTLSRRSLLRQASSGFGALALSALMNCRGWSAESNQLADQGHAMHGLHHPAKAKSVIFLYMDGGPSQLDTFDRKPLLEKYHGQDPAQFFKVEATQFNNNGTVLASPWKFDRYGECGHEISSLFPHVATCADELCIVRSMVSEFPEHTFANYFLHTGSGLQGRPSMGAWTTYGLGSVNENLPGFVVLNGGLIPPGGLDCFGNGFLPASYQGSVFKPSGTGVANIEPREGALQRQKSKLDLLAALDEASKARFAGDEAIESAIRNYELAAQMQVAVPELMDLSGETQETKDLYGFNAPYEQTRIYAAECLIARRLVERGVRFVELTCPSVDGDRWDQHFRLKEGHENNARAVDQPIAALLKDLRRRGLLDSTLVVWAGEFGRTPFAQGTDGRDHNQFGFTIWLAGGGVRPGIVYGATDEWGYRAIENRTEIHDLHATMLHLLGVDHTRSTFRFGGRDMRLTDVKGHIMQGILA
jgi:hypothetical protein